MDPKLKLFVRELPDVLYIQSSNVIGNQNCIGILSFLLLTFLQDLKAAELRLKASLGLVRSLSAVILSVSFSVSGSSSCSSSSLLLLSASYRALGLMRAPHTVQPQHKPNQIKHLAQTEKQLCKARVLRPNMDV